MKRVLVLILVLVLAVVGIVAQDDESEAVDCTPDYVTLFEATLADMQEDGADLDDVLNTFEDAYQVAKIACNGLSFDSDEYGNAPVLGPLELDGMYLISLETDGFFSMEPTTISGTCGDDIIEGLPIFTIFQGQADDGAQEIYETANCRVLFDISNTTSDWVLTLEKLD